jgi:glycerol kinase
MLERGAGVRERAERGELAFGTVDSWLAWQLSGGAAHVTDASNASRTLLFNIHTLDWDDELLGVLRIPRAVLPRIVASSDVIAETQVEGLPNGIAIAASPATSRRRSSARPATRPDGEEHLRHRLLPAHERRRAAGRISHRLLSTVAWRYAGETRYALEGSVFIGGAAIQWLRDGLGFIASAPEVEALASGVPDSGGVFFVPALSGLGAPYWDPRARGTIVGLTRGSGRAHIARATLEAIAFQSAELIEAMSADSRVMLTELRVDGGASACNLLMQMQADLLGVPVVRPKVTETTGARRGVSRRASRSGSGRTRPRSRPSGSAIRVFEPTLSQDAARSRLDQWKRAVERSREWDQA